MTPKEAIHRKAKFAGQAFSRESQRVHNKETRLNGAAEGLRPDLWATKHRPRVVVANDWSIGTLSTFTHRASDWCGSDLLFRQQFLRRQWPSSIPKPPLRRSLFLLLWGAWALLLGHGRSGYFRIRGVHDLLSEAAHKAMQSDSLRASGKVDMRAEYLNAAEACQWTFLAGLALLVLFAGSNL